MELGILNGAPLLICEVRRKYSVSCLAAAAPDFYLGFSAVLRPGRAECGQNLKLTKVSNCRFGFWIPRTSAIALQHDAESESQSVLAGAVNGCNF